MPRAALASDPRARRWWIVGALFVLTYGVSMPLAAYGVFLPVVAEALGWSRGAVASALSFSLLLGGVAGAAIGAIADRHEPRPLLVATVGLAGAGFALVSTVTALWQLYLFVGVMAGVGTSTFYLLSAATVTHWFTERRALALALVLVGFNLGYISGGPLAAWLIASIGWRAAYAVLGGGCGAMAVVAALTVRLPRTAEARALRGSAATAANAAPAPTLRGVLGDPRQWCLNVSWLLLGGTTLMLTVHVVPFARDKGISLAGASLALSAYGLGAVTGRVVTGIVADRLGAIPTVRAAYVSSVLALLALALAPSRPALLASLAVFGVGFAASDTMIVKVIPEVFGLRSIGAVMGVLTLGWRCGAAVGPAGAGFLYDLTGSYAVPFGIAPVAVLASWGFFTLATSRRSLGKERDEEALTPPRPR